MILGLLLLIMIVMAIVNALPFLMAEITSGLSASVICVMELLSTVATSTTNQVILWGLIGTNVLTELFDRTVYRT